MFPVLPLADPAAGDPSGKDVLLPPAYEIFWSAVVLLLLWFVLGWAVPKIYAVLDERQQKIEEGLSAADDAKEKAALAERERKEMMQRAAEEAKSLRDEATSDARRIVADANQEANEEAARITANAKKQITAERQAAQVSLRQDVGGLATDLAERILGEQLKDKALSERVIDRFMDELEADLENTSKVDA